MVAADARHLLHLFGEPVGQLPFPLAHRRQSFPLQKADAGFQPGDARHVQRAAFEHIGQKRRLGQLQRIAAGAPWVKL